MLCDQTWFVEKGGFEPTFEPGSKRITCMGCVHSGLATYGVVSGVEVGCEEMVIMALILLPYHGTVSAGRV